MSMKQENIIVQNQEGGEGGGGSMIVYIRRSEKGVVSVQLTLEVAADEYNPESHL